MVPCHFSRISSVLLVVFLLFGFTLFIPTIQARAFKPAGRFHPSSNYIDRIGLFIAASDDYRGSKRNGNTFNQVGETKPFVIDLSVSWNTSNPRFKKLSDSPPIFYGPSTISADGKQWVVFDNTTVYIYNLETTKWSTLFHPLDYEADSDTAVMNPETGLIYIPTTGDGYLMRLNITSRSYDRLAMPPSLSNAHFYAAAWSASQKKMYMIGGKTGGPPSTQLTHLIMSSYSDKDGWYNLTRDAKGDVPQPRFGACLVPAFGGSKMVLFGGHTVDRLTTLNDIHILDLTTMIWKRGPDVAQKEQRALAACAMSNDHFIAWGGGYI
jgi:hypothetical protein